MIVALEGPDLCGKSTLFDALREVLVAVYVPRLPLDLALLPHIAAAEARNEALWRALYDPSKLYISDRHFTVTDAVYSRVYGRPRVDYSFWLPELCIVYLDAPLDLLLYRYNQRGDDTTDSSVLGALLAAYDDVLDEFPRVTELDASLRVPQLAALCVDAILKWREMQ